MEKQALIIQQLIEGDIKTIARVISLIENEVPGYEKILSLLPVNNNIPVVGITGPPGVGKSTLTDALIGELVKEQKKVAVLCVDPSSVFHHGALLGDRIRMSDWYVHPNVYIRSLAARGILGGLHPQIISITDMLKATGFDMIIIETVGVGQNEIDIAQLANITIVVLAPETGDDIQTIKSGLMEIADIFVINKSDHPQAANMEYFLRQSLQGDRKNIPVIKTIASQKSGISELYKQILQVLSQSSADKHFNLLQQKIYQLLVTQKIRSIDKAKLSVQLKSALQQPDFNMYSFIQKLDERNL